MAEIGAGQRWEAIGAPDDWIVTLEPDGDEAWIVRMAVGLERSLLTAVLLDSYQLADLEDDVRAAAEAGGDLVGVDEVEGPNSA